eukprot:SAG31_NODE_33418_length_344_cov_0.632653_1_plen_51_part_10
MYRLRRPVALSRFGIRELTATLPRYLMRLHLGRGGAAGPVWYGYCRSIGIT